MTLGGGREELEASWSGLQGRDDTTTTTSSSSYQSGAEMLSQDKPVYTQFRSAKNITSGVTGSIYSRAFWLMTPLDPGPKEKPASKLPNAG